MTAKDGDIMLKGKMYTIKNEQGTVLLKNYHSAVMPEKRGYRDHHHTEFEIGLIKQGSGIYRSGDRQYDIRRGDIFLFSTDEHHCITEITGKEEMVIMNVQFAPRLLWSQRDIYDAKLLKIFLGRSSRFENRIDRQSPSTRVIESHLLAIEEEFERGESEYELMVKVHLLSILIELLRGYDYVEDGEEIGAKGASYDKMARAMDFIDANITSDLQLSELASIAGMNKTYFSTLFKKLNGMSPWDYITVKRIDLARRLLSDKDKTVLEVAMLCGFNNTANFNRAFRKVTGKTPSEISV